MAAARSRQLILALVYAALFLLLLWVKNHPPQFLVLLADGNLIENDEALFYFLAGLTFLFRFIQARGEQSLAFPYLLWGLLALFLGMEEIDWGQKILGLHPGILMLHGKATQLQTFTLTAFLPIKDIKPLMHGVFFVWGVVFPLLFLAFPKLREKLFGWGLIFPSLSGTFGLVLGLVLRILVHRYYLHYADYVFLEWEICDFFTALVLWVTALESSEFLRRGNPPRKKSRFSPLWLVWGLLAVYCGFLLWAFYFRILGRWPVPAYEGYDVTAKMYLTIAGNYYMSFDDYRRGLPLLEKAQSEDWSDPKMHLGLLKGYLLKGDQNKALKQVEWFEKSSERGEPAFPVIGEAVAANQLERALKLYRFYLEH